MRAEVDVGVEELLDERAKRIRVNQRGNLIAKLEFVEYLLNVRAEATEVGFKVRLKLLLPGAGLEVSKPKRRVVVKGVIGIRTGSLAKCCIFIGDACLVELFAHLEHVLLRRLQAGVEAADDRHRQNHVAVLAAHVNVSQDVVRNTPDKIYDPVKLSVLHSNSRHLHFLVCIIGLTSRISCRESVSLFDQRSSGCWVINFSQNCLGDTILIA